MKQRNDLFFLFMALLLLGIVISGFGPTFFFRKVNADDGFGKGLPKYLFIHGVVLSLWMLLFVAQSALIRTKRIHWHRILGWFGTVLVLPIIVTGIMAIKGFGPRLLALGLSPKVVREGLAPLFWGDTLSLIVFPALVAVAIVLRNKPDSHKRYLLFGNILLVVPAVGRLTSRMFGEGSPIVLVALLAILLSVPLYDILKFRRLHRATIFGFTAVFLALVLSLLIAATEWGKDISVMHFIHS